MKENMEERKIIANHLSTFDLRLSNTSKLVPERLGTNYDTPYLYVQIKRRK